MRRMLMMLLAVLAAMGELAADDKAARQKRLPELVLRSDRSDITLGETVLLTSVIPAHYPIPEILLYRLKDVWIAATYDPDQERIVCEKQPFRSVDTFSSELGKNKFSELDLESLRGSGRLHFNVRDPRVEGFELPVKPKYVGSFLVNVEWTTVNRDDAPSSNLESQPVLITVRPPKDDRGRPIIKSEWLPTVANVEGRAFEDSYNYTSPFPEDQQITDTSDPLSREHAAELAAEQSTLFLEVKKLTPEVARVLTTRANNQFPVYLSGVTALDGPDAVAVAEALASTPAPVVIKHLQRVSAPALAALRKKATITIPPDEKLTIVP